jgi:hypothetical protein
MKKILITLSMAIAMQISAQFDGTKQVYQVPNLKAVIAQQKTVAIIPFEAKITYRKQPKNFDFEANKERERVLSKNIQSSLYTFLLRKSSNYTVTFQDIEKTNILLKKAGMMDKMDEFTKDEIAKALNVDAVLGGKFEMEQTQTEAGAIASAVLFGNYAGKTGTGALTLLINDAKDGELVWRFFKSMDDNITSSSDDLVERMMRKVSRNFPYQKDAK